MTDPEVWKAAWRAFDDKRSVELTFFKPSGKFYSSHKTEVYGLYHEIVDRIRVMHKESNLPGLTSGGGAFHVVATIDGVPHLFLSGDSK